MEYFQWSGIEIAIINLIITGEKIDLSLMVNTVAVTQ